MDGQAGYLCQDSTKAEDDTKFTVDTYMEMFLRKDYKKEQKYHITLMRTETQFAEVEKRRRRRIYTGGVERETSKPSMQRTSQKKTEVSTSG